MFYFALEQLGHTKQSWINATSSLKKWSFLQQKTRYFKSLVSRPRKVNSNFDEVFFLGQTKKEMAKRSKKRITSFFQYAPFSKRNPSINVLLSSSRLFSSKHFFFWTILPRIFVLFLSVFKLKWSNNKINVTFVFNLEFVIAINRNEHFSNSWWYAASSQHYHHPRKDKENQILCGNFPQKSSSLLARFCYSLLGFVHQLHFALQ